MSQPTGPTSDRLKAAALSEVSDHDGGKRLADLEAMISRADIEPPSSYPILAEFNRELAHLVTHHGDETTVKGRDTGDLFDEEGPAITALRTFVARRARAYLAQFETLVDHPMAAHRPARYQLQAWGVRMRRQDDQVTHVDQNAWISGMYYVQLPDSVVASDPDHRGWIQFGRGTDDVSRQSEPTTCLICPRVGTLLIFPSFAWHRTLPFAGESERISIAFDLIPET